MTTQAHISEQGSGGVVCCERSQARTHAALKYNKRPRGLDDLLDLLPDESNIALWILAI